MRLCLDHIVHAVRDPEQARRDFTRALAWHTLAGGRHEDWGTYNALAYFGLTYVEWVAVFDPGLAAQSEFGRWLFWDLERGEGLAQFALRTQAMDDIVDRWRQAGLEFIGPLPGRRVRPDGSVLKWRLLFPARAQAERFPLPFVIEWDMSDEQRLADLRRSGALGAEDKRDCLRAVHAAVADIAAAREAILRYFGDYAQPESLASHLGHGLLWCLGDVNLYLWQAESPRLQRLVSERGERLFRIDVERPAALGVAEQGEAPGVETSDGEEEICLHGAYIHLIRSSAGP
jgi:hypothetical protein